MDTQDSYRRTAQYLPEMQEQTLGHEEMTPPSRTCPKCGHELLIKEGQYGQFIGCSAYPDCRYTSNTDGTKTTFKAEVTEWDELGKPTQISNIIQPKEPKKNQCPNCNGKGKLPFEKDGKVVPNTFVFCECSPYSHPEQDQFREVRPDDIDYPVSFSHYRALCRYHGWHDPGTDNALAVDPPTPIIQKRITFVESSAQVQIDLLRRRVDNHIKPAPARPPVQKKGTDGEVDITDSLYPGTR